MPQDRTIVIEIGACAELLKFIRNKLRDGRVLKRISISETTGEATLTFEEP
jgi:hypothetical protein